MSFDPEVADDCLLLDGMETVTLHSTSVVPVAGAKRGRLSLAEVEFRQLGIESSDLSWLLPAVSLQGVVPRRGDTIEDAEGASWTILSASKSPLSGVWRVVSRRHV